jgi:RimJ/RimL family protein N-acetyltransferase
MRKDLQLSAPPDGLRTITDKDVIEPFLRGDTALHVYSIGDLDDFFWPCTTWYGWHERGKLAALFLMYRGTGLPVLLALEERLPEASRALLKALLPLLPRNFYAHLSPYLAGAFAGSASLETHGRHLKMSLAVAVRLKAGILSSYPTRSLLSEDLPGIMDLYAQSYPGNWFDRKMLETGKYHGAFLGSRLIAIAGVHVYSKKYRVAALGNITTHPEFRGKGLGASITATVCEDLLKDVDLIGLNVLADNKAAIRCYERIGFEVSSVYDEFAVTKN